jgi:hypothetical protein
MNRNLVAILLIVSMVPLAGCSSGGTATAPSATQTATDAVDTNTPTDTEDGPTQTETQTTANPDDDESAEPTTVSGASLLETHAASLAEAQSKTISIYLAVNGSSQNIAQTVNFSLSEEEDYVLTSAPNGYNERFTNATGTWHRYIADGGRVEVTFNAAPYDESGSPRPINESLALRFGEVTSTLTNVELSEHGTTTFNGSRVTVYRATSVEDLTGEMAETATEFNGTILIETDTGIIRDVDFDIHTDSAQYQYDFGTSAIGSTDVKVPDWVSK